MSWSSARVPMRTIDLEHQQMLIIEDRPGTRVHVLLGGMWLTEERHLQDRFASAGEALTLEAAGRAVIEALGRSRLCVVEAERRVLARWRQVLARGRFAALVPRTLAAALALVLGIGLPELLGRGAHIPGAHDPASVVSTAIAPRLAG